eukprot:scaffold12612_cov36-Tisochrysis_lutea.AAC.3
MSGEGRPSGLRGFRAGCEGCGEDGAGLMEDGAECRPRGEACLPCEIEEQHLSPGASGRLA